MFRGLYRFLKQPFLAIALRLEQEMMIMRYALYCRMGEWSSALLIIRLITLVLTLTVGCTLVMVFKDTFYFNQQFFRYFVIFAYLFFMINSIWERGKSKERIRRWKWGLVTMLVLQYTFLVLLFH